MLLHPALVKLFVKLRVARVRRIFSGRSTRRLVMSILGLALMSLWLGTVALSFASGTRTGEPLDASWISIITLGLLLLGLLGNNTDQVLAFTPAEVDQLFPGPFTRRQLLAYRLMGTLLGTLVGGLIFGIFLRNFAHTYVLSALGAFLLLAHVNMGAMVIALVRQGVAARLYTTTRKTVVIGLLVIVGVAAWWALAPQAPPIEELLAMKDAPAVRAMLLPLHPLELVFGAASVMDALIGGAMASILPLAMLLSVFALDRNCEEVMLEASRKRAQRLERLQGKVKLTGQARSRRLVRIPFLGPASVIVGRQMLSALRGSRTHLLIMLLIPAVFIAPSLIAPDKSEAIMRNVFPIIMAWGLFLIPTLFRFDFRAELDHLELLKSLPLRPFALVAAELFTPVAVATLLFVGICAALPSGRDAIQAYPWIAPGVPVVALLIVAIENLSFLLWPERQGKPGNDAMAVSGRRMLLSLARFSAIGIGAGAAFLVALLTKFFTSSINAAGLGGVIALFAIDLVLLRLIVVAFTRFDVSADLPE